MRRPSALRGSCFRWHVPCFRPLSSEGAWNGQGRVSWLVGHSRLTVARQRRTLTGFPLWRPWHPGFGSPLPAYVVVGWIVAPRRKSRQGLCPSPEQGRASACPSPEGARPVRSSASRRSCFPPAPRPSRQSTLLEVARAPHPLICLYPFTDPCCGLQAAVPFPPPAHRSPPSAPGARPCGVRRANFFASAYPFPRPLQPHRFPRRRTLRT